MCSLRKTFQLECLRYPQSEVARLTLCKALNDLDRVTGRVTAFLNGESRLSEKEIINVVNDQIYSDCSERNDSGRDKKTCKCIFIYRQVELTVRSVLYDRLNEFDGSSNTKIRHRDCTVIMRIRIIIIQVMIGIIGIKIDI